jgi:GNAT superfamily N-acetyltransferase
MSIKIVKGPFSSFDERDLAQSSYLDCDAYYRQPSTMLFEAKISNTDIVVAKDGDDIVGWATAHMFQGYQIVNVFVDSHLRNKGIATSLLENFKPPFIIFADKYLIKRINSKYNNYDMDEIKKVVQMPYCLEKEIEVSLWSEHLLRKYGVEISFFEDGRRDQIKDEISAIYLKWSENGML